MIQRCTNKKNAAYKDYGGRGISVCERWSTFMNFYADMGSRPPGATLDRIDNDADYSPENCRWATKKQQASNKRNSIKVEIEGKTLSLAGVRDETGIPLATLRYRLNSGHQGNDLIREKKLNQWASSPEPWKKA